ncbi:recombinase family protein [Pseudonocardia sp. ICBG601]|uniref:recombinase family protein n=1 Tax=Pseudonocardia sp. ICBG601 TaxID=2846759 RepID=UPI001CF70631|nr:recombinase family protein [Pseudonocardia sp. ICBG601]
MELGYARVSTTHQDLERQLDALGHHGIPDERIYTDKKPAPPSTGPASPSCAATPLRDTIIATNLDRLGRNLRECLNVVHELREQGIGIKTLKDPIPIDTTDDSPMAELAVALLALFAHMERVFMRERAATPARPPQPRANCPADPQTRPQPARRGPGRPRHGQTADQIAAAFGVSRATLYRNLTENKPADQQ